MCTNLTFHWRCVHKTDRKGDLGAKTLVRCDEAKARGKHHICEQIKEKDVGNSRKRICPRCRPTHKKTGRIDEQNHALGRVQAGLRSAEMRFRKLSLGAGINKDTVGIHKKEAVTNRNDDAFERKERTTNQHGEGPEQTGISVLSS